jgi:hypothetical protein
MLFAFLIFALLLATGCTTSGLVDPHWGNQDMDHDGIINSEDFDVDGDGVQNDHDVYPLNPYAW